MKPQDWWIKENPQLRTIFDVGLTEEQKQDLRIYYTSGDISQLEIRISPRSVSFNLEKIIQETTIEQYESITGRSRYE